VGYARPATSAMGFGAAAPGEPGSGMSWGGGVGYDFSPRLSATLEWISYALKMPTGPIRTPNLGLQYRY